MSDAPSTKRSRVARFPDDWFDGSIWEVTPGEDTRSKNARNAQAAILTAARLRGVRVRTMRHAGKVYVQATDNVA